MGVSIHKQCSPKGIPSFSGHLRHLRHLREAKTAAEDQATKLATEEAQEEAKEGLGEKSMAVVATCQKRMGLVQNGKPVCRRRCWTPKNNDDCSAIW